MPSTPHISLRVSASRLSSWKKACRNNNTDVSSQIRKLMDAWVKIEEFKDDDSDLQSISNSVMRSFVEVSENN